MDTLRMLWRMLLRGHANPQYNRVFRRATGHTRRDEGGK